MHRLSTVLVLAFSMLIASCAGDEPGGPSDVGPDGGLPDIQAPGPVSLSIQAVDASTPWPYIIVKGEGPENGTITYDGGPGGQRTEPIGGSGVFCIQVDIADGSNTIKFEARDSEGNLSDALYIEVAREGERPEDDESGLGDPDIVDRTADATFYGTSDGGGEADLDAGEWMDLVDESETNLVKFSGEGWNNETIVFELAEAVKVHGFKVTVPAAQGDTCGPQGFSMYLANESEPGTDTGETSKWFKAAGVVIANAVAPEQNHLVEGGTYTLENFTPMRGLTSTHFAIVGTNASCGVFSNVYEVAEIRVLAERDGANLPPPTDPGPSCLDGGN